MTEFENFLKQFKYMNVNLSEPTDGVKPSDGLIHVWEKLQVR